MWTRLDLDNYKGEFLALLGPSGSGKATTLLMLAGFEAVTFCDITLNNQSLNNVSPFTRHMGIVFQNYALFPHETVFQKIAFPLVRRMVAKADIAQRVNTALPMGNLQKGHQHDATGAGGKPAR